MSKEFETSRYQEEVLEEVGNELNSYDNLRLRCRYVSFESRSAGRGRRRRPRQVELLVVDDSYAHTIKDNEIKSRMKRDCIGPDVLAQELLTDLPEDERTVDTLLERIKLQSG